MMSNDGWATAAFREQVERATDAILAGEVEGGAMRLWRVALSTGELAFAGALWQIWGRITDEFTHADGSTSQGEALAQEAAAELHAALGNCEQEHQCCDRWIYERLDIIL